MAQPKAKTALHQRRKQSCQHRNTAHVRKKRCAKTRRSSERKINVKSGNFLQNSEIVLPQNFKTSTPLIARRRALRVLQKFVRQQIKNSSSPESTISPIMDKVKSLSGISSDPCFVNVTLNGKLGVCQTINLLADFKTFSMIINLTRNGKISIKKLKNMQLIAHVNGRFLVINSTTKEKVKITKRKIGFKFLSLTGNAIDQHEILYGGKLLDESKSLDQYGIKNDSTLTVKMPLIGANTKNKNYKHDNGSSSSSSGSSFYSNLNLNQNHKCSHASRVQSHSKPQRNKQHYVSENYERREIKSDLCKTSTCSEIPNSFSFNHEPEDAKKCRKSNIRTNTLSLHITAYENSIEAAASDSLENQNLERFEDCVISKKRLCNKEYQAVLKPQFEFPRQQNDTNSKPEVMQFKASQKLLDPNKTDSTGLNASNSDHSNFFPCNKCNFVCINEQQHESHQKYCFPLPSANDSESPVKPSSNRKPNKREPYKWEDPRAKALMEPLLHSDGKVQRNVLQQLAVDLGIIFNKKVPHSTLSEKISKLKKQLNNMPVKESDSKSIINESDKQLGLAAVARGTDNGTKVSEDVRALMNQFNQQQQQLISNFNNNLLKVLGTDKASKSSSSDKVEPNVKKRILGGKIQITNYKIGFNERLNKNVVIVESGKTAIEYRQKDVKKKVKYYNCSRCGSTATLYENDEFWASPHATDCNPYPKAVTAASQSELKAKEFVLMGILPRKAYDLGFVDAVENEAEDAYKPYWKKKNVLTRANQNKLGLQKCSIGNTADCFKMLISSTPNLRWFLTECPRYAAFSSDRQLRALAEAVVVAGDCTFSIRPDNTSQVFTLFALVDSDTGMEWVGVFMAVMTTKEQADYEAIIQEILSAWQRLNIKPTFGRVHSDYEDGLMNALKLLGGEDKLFGCNFHFCQATYRMIVKLKLYSHYKAGISRDNVYHIIRKWLRDLLCLPFLMKQDIQFYWNNVLKFPPKPVADNIPWPVKELEEMVEYYEKEWISRKDNSFCFFGLDRVRNVNVLECFHSVGKQRFPKRPTYKNFLDAQRMAFSQYESRLKQLELGYDSRPQEHKYSDMDARLKCCEVDYIEGKANAENPSQLIRVLAAHLKRVNYVVHDIRNRSTNTVKSAKKSGKNEDALKAVLFDKTLDSMDYNEQASIVDKTITGDTDDAEDQQDYDIDQIYKSMVAEEFHLSCELGSDISITLSDDDNGEKPAKIRKIEKQKEDAKSVKQKDDGQDDGISVDESMFQQPPLQERPSLFDAPTVEQLQQALIALGIDPEEAYGSPLLLHHNNNISQKAENPFAIHKIDGDGNCGFRAVSYLLTGTQKYHWQLRLIATNELAVNGEKWDRIVGRVERIRYVHQARQLARMAPRPFEQPEWYLNNDHLFVLSSIINMNIYTVCKSKYNTLFQPHSSSGYRSNESHPNLFIWFAHRHFTACVRPR